jgi:hypothetical protein
MKKMQEACCYLLYGLIGPEWARGAGVSLYCTLYGMIGPGPRGQ